ncbi:hypothetical protein DBR47_03370 [Paucibacter sp. KBW04]|nr:hypothetical protein DBR47_03370 [Paucibacter sp. KBW04]
MIRSSSTVGCKNPPTSCHRCHRLGAPSCCRFVKRLNSAPSQPNDHPGAAEPNSLSSHLCKPQVIRCDNGPEQISATMLDWASARGIHIVHIQPGKPQQNAYVKRFNRTVRYEWLSPYHWPHLDEVRDFATQWIWRYNHERPNMALGDVTPKQRLAMAA